MGFIPVRAPRTRGQGAVMVLLWLAVMLGTYAASCLAAFTAGVAVRVGWAVGENVDLCAWGLADCGPEYRKLNP